MSDDEIIEVVRARKEGRRIEMCLVTCSEPKGAAWEPQPPGAPWDFESLEYRVAPEPREWWATVTRSGRFTSFNTEPPSVVVYDEELIHVREVLSGEKS